VLQENRSSGDGSVAIGQRSGHGRRSLAGRSTTCQGRGRDQALHGSPTATMTTTAPFGCPFDSGWQHVAHQFDMGERRMHQNHVPKLGKLRACTDVSAEEEEKNSNFHPPLQNSRDRLAFHPSALLLLFLLLLDFESRRRRHHYAQLAAPRFCCVIAASNPASY
jgi:hypothetical protein